MGILFDWEALVYPILEGCLPRIQDSVVEGGAAFYLNSKNEIIATTDVQNFPVNKKVSLPNKNMSLETGDSASGIFETGGKKFIIGSSKTQGYREYRGLEWTAHVVRPIN